MLKRFLTALFLAGQLVGQELRAEDKPVAKAEAIKDLTAKATQGDHQAQIELAVRLRDGKGVKQNHARAMRWAHAAADQGTPEALDFLGYAYLNGIGVVENTDLAFGYFKSAAEKSSRAAYHLGECYFGAQGVEQDTKKALEAWKKAVELGSGRAASSAGMAYLAGDGIPQDKAEALRLITKAAELNDPEGLVVLGELKYQAGDMEQARANWTKVSKMHPVGATGNPESSSEEMAAQQGADLLKLMEYRNKKSEPGKFALVKTSHVFQGYNNCGATSCTMLARFEGSKIGAWDYKRNCSSPLGTGTDWKELLEASAKIGLHWKLVTFTPDDPGFEKATEFLYSELDAGRPVVIDFKYLGPQYPDGEAGHTLTVAGYIRAEKLFILCNPAIPTPGLELITADDLKKYWRSDHYSELSNDVLSRPAIVIEKPHAAEPVKN